MKKLFFTILSTFLYFLPISMGQDNFAVSYSDASSSPDFLNVCESTDTVTVQVSLAGLSNDSRTNISADINFFKGIRFESFNSDLSSAGVSVTNDVDPGQISISIPDMDPVSNPTVDITLVISADCQYLDSIAINDLAIVRDVWTFNYDLGNNSGLSESDFTDEYRDALKFAVMNIGVADNDTKYRVGDCLTREIEVFNSGLEGYITSFEYQSTIGDGLYLEGVTINGLHAVLQKTPLVTGDTLVEILVDNSFISLNTNGANPGNGDANFDPFETATIIESLCVISCNGSLASQFEVNWGCNGFQCEDVTASDFIEIGSGSANVNVIAQTDISDSEVGYCQTGIQTLRIENAGFEQDPGFAYMKDIIVSINLSAGNIFSQDGISITKITIAGVDIGAVALNNNLDGNALFETDPDGTGGLEDLDLDGYHDDLDINEFFLVQYEFEYDCDVFGNAQSIDDNCGSNNISFPINAKIEYTDQCDTRNRPNVGNGIKRITNTLNDVESNSDPDAFMIQDSFNVTYQFTRNVFSFEKDCGVGASYIAKVFLADGIQPVDDDIALFYNNSGTPLTKTSSVVSGDTLEVRFDASAFPFLNGIYRMEYGFTADCSADISQVFFPVTFEHECPSCDCTQLWFCDEIAGPYIHALSPPCDPPTCPIGMIASSFNANRTTFGFDDAGFSIPSAPKNTQVGINCDEFEFELKSVVGDALISDSSYVRLSYQNIDNILSLEETFIFQGGTIEIFDGTSTFNCNVSALSFRLLADSLNKTLLIDLGDCLVDYGTNLNPGDSLNFVGTFSVNENAPLLNQFRTVPNLRIDMVHIENDSIFSCENFGESITLATTNSITDFPNSNDYPSGCDNLLLEYKVITVNNGFEDQFVDEFRQSVKIDSIDINFDANLFTAFDSLRAEISLPGHPTFGSSFIPVSGFENATLGSFVARFDTMSYISNYNETVPFDFNFRIVGIPRCEASNASANGNNIYLVNTQMFYQNKIYSQGSSTGSCYETVEEQSSNQVEYNDPPELNINSQTDPNLVFVGDTLIYDIEVCNLSFESDAGSNWLSLDDENGAFEIVSIQDVTDGANIVDLSVEQVGTSSRYFILGNALMMADFGSTFDEVCNVYRITTVMNICGTNPIVLETGWNCTPPDVNDWNPFDDNTCNTEVFNISGRSEEASLDATIFLQPVSPFDICEENEIQILIQNTGIGNLFNLSTDFIIPNEGISIIPGSAQYSYPPGNGLTPIASDPVFKENTLRGRVLGYDDFSDFNPFLDTQGLPGFNAGNPTDSNQILISYRYITDCDFSSGSRTFFQVQGLTPCGEATNTEIGESDFIVINNVDIPPTSEYEVRSESRLYFESNTETHFVLSVANTGSNNTAALDSIVVKIPDTFDFVENSTIRIEGPAMGTLEPRQSQSNGFLELSWGMPIGVTTGSTFEFGFDIRSPSLGCDVSNVEIVYFTKDAISAFCNTIGENCNIDRITSANGINIIDIPYGDSPINTSIESDVAVCTLNNQELLTITGNFVFENQPIADASIDIFLIIDDGNSRFDGGDIIKDTLTLVGPFLGNETTPFSFEYAVDPTEICNVSLAGRIEDPNVCPEMFYPIQVPHLNNAGEDMGNCPILNPIANFVLGDESCGSLEGYTYNWTSIPANAANLLSSIDTLHPQLTYDYSGTFDMVQYILQTSRNGCGLKSRDTVTVYFDTCPFDMIDSIKVSEYDTLLFCIDTMSMSGNYQSFNTDCTDINAINKLTFNNFVQDACIEIIGDMTGHDTLCYEVISDTDTLIGFVAVEVLPVEVNLDIIRDTIFVNESSNVCIDTLELIGQAVSIFDSCNDANGTSVDFDINTNTYCADYIGLFPGIDTACIVVCDDLGVCDTTLLIVTTEGFAGPPTAVLDCDTTAVNTPKVIPALRNDTIFGGLEDFSIIEQPLWGEAIVNLDGSLTYVPDPRYCERLDSFHYQICNPVGCDTAMVKVWIFCTDIVVFNAMSPNGDGENDEFYIANIEDFPDNELRVYNRWGNIVFQKNNYDNSWDGTWDGNKNLPDGTYYYILRLFGDTPRLFKGSLELYR